MLSSGRPRVATRTLSVRVHRLTAALAVAALPFALTACGLLGGDTKDQSPVVIPSQAEDDGSGVAPAGDASSSPPPAISLSPDPAAITTDGADVAPVVESTVTRTGIVTQKSTTTRTSTATATLVATKTLPQVTVTPPALTVTATTTETRTETSTSRVTAQPGPGVTTTVTCTIGPLKPAC